MSMIEGRNGKLALLEVKSISQRSVNTLVETWPVHTIQLDHRSSLLSQKYCLCDQGNSYAAHSETLQDTTYLRPHCFSILVEELHV